MQKVNSLTVGQWCDRPLMFMQPGHAEAIFAADGAPDAQKDHHGSRRWLHQICGSAANLRCPGSENGTVAKELAQMLDHYRPTITRQSYEPYLMH